MTQPESADVTDSDELICDCGYRSRGQTLTARVQDAQQHACAVHGIEVTAQQVLMHGEEGRT
jgi:hypothetical protein